MISQNSSGEFLVVFQIIFLLEIFFPSLLLPERFHQNCHTVLAAVTVNRLTYSRHMYVLVAYL